MSVRYPPSPDAGPYRVLIARDKFTDPARDGRAVPFKVYYPADGDGPFPAVVWSHGLGGSADGAAFLVRYIASHGYAVVNVQHPGTDSSLWEGKPGHPWDVIRATPIPRGATIDRFRDVPFLLDRLPGWAEGHPDLKGRLDMDRLGMSGHSFGALTTQVMAGQAFPGENREPTRLREERFRAGILYSPVPLREWAAGREDEVYGPIALPLLHMTGTADDSPVERFGYEERLAVFDHAGGPEQHLVVLEGGDHMVYAGSRGQLGENPKRRQHEDIIKVLSLVFWDAWLKEDAAAREWLAGGGMADWLGAEARCRFRA